MSNDRTDYNTLIPVLEKRKNAFGDTLEAVTADSGYCSEKNLLYLKENGIRSYIKLQDLSLKMSIITSAMTEGNYIISGRKAKSRTVIPRQ